MTFSNNESPVEPSSEQILSVAVPRPLTGLFTYRLPQNLAPLIRVGGWVKVPFGRSVTHAFVVEPPRAIQEIPKGVSSTDLKEILEVGDSESLFSPDVFSLCKWAHEYYFAPLGEVLQCAASVLELGNGNKDGKKNLKQEVKQKSATPRVSVILTEEQNLALEKLEGLRQQNAGHVALLKGITGSGKTEIYLELAKRTLAQGKGVIVLVPEIALTSQLYRRFETGLGVPVGLWHSALSPKRKRDQISALKRGELQVMVGARSAVFAPVKNLGLMIVDEEHDPSYKQEDRVKYNARDLAIVRTKEVKGFAVLGSATPSLETQERVREGRYSIAVLNQRVTGGGIPEVELVDLCTEEKIEKIQAPLAVRTIQAIQQTLAAGEQVIVYLNRRGFASFLLCQDCREVSRCPQCSVSLTVYKKKSQLKCHVCGYHAPIPTFCSKCLSLNLEAKGAGTESLEEELPRLIPEAKILRLDRDQITSMRRLERVLDSFRQGSANLLLGTQMLVKGHDFPHVTLVVVVLADALFRWPDFRAPERAVQILRQVSGRAGRGEKAGRVLIQTYDPLHSVLQVIQGKQSEPDFLENELQLRKALGYPPFGRFARLRFENHSRDEVIRRARLIANQVSLRFKEEIEPHLHENRNLEVLGPSEAFLERAKGIYRWDLIFKSKTFPTLQRTLIYVRGLCATHKIPFLVDIDPYGI